MSDSDHLAIGPALGYAYQFDRATVRLLEADSSVVSVAVEHVDDVSIHRADGSSIREQDKATIADGGPFTDKSVALWKTVAIWADAAMVDPEVIDSTEFHLVTNGTVRSNSLAARINAAKTSPEMTSVATELRDMADRLRADLQPFATKIRRLDPGVLAALVGKIFVFDKAASSFEGKLENIQSLRLLGEFQRTAVFYHAAGWVRRTVQAAAKESKPTLIDRKAFEREVRALIRRVAVAPLAVVFDTLNNSAVDPADYRSFGFFQQLDWIDTEPDFVRDCVIHYVQALVARVKWTDADVVSEASLLAYQEDLKTRWKLHVRRQSLKQYSSPIFQGQELLIDTLSEDTTLDGQPMPKAITCGNFHALADFDTSTIPQIGWHPEFEKKAKDTRSGS